MPPQSGVLDYTTAPGDLEDSDAFAANVSPTLAFPSYSVAGQLPYYPSAPLYQAFPSNEHLSPTAQHNAETDLGPAPTGSTWPAPTHAMSYSNGGSLAYDAASWDHLHAPVASSTRFVNRSGDDDVQRGLEDQYSALPVTGEALQLEDMSHGWSGSALPRDSQQPTGLTASALGLGLGASPQSVYDGQNDYQNYAVPVPSYQPPNTSILPPAKRRTSRPSSASSSEYAGASPYLHPAAPHCPPWLNMSPSTTQSLSMDQQHQQWRSGSYLPRSASLPHLPDYGQGYSAQPYAYPSPNPSPAYSSLQNSPNPPAGLSLRGSPFNDSNSSISPRDRTLPFHSPASSITNKLALSKLSTWVAPSPAPTPKPPPITPYVDPNHITTTHAQSNRIKYGIVGGNGEVDSPGSSSSRRQSDSSHRQPRAVTSRKNMSEADVFCCQCHDRIGKVIMRGTEQQRGVPWQSGMECLNCLPPDERGDEAGDATTVDEGDVSRYENMFSAALDKLDGLDLTMEDSRPPPSKAKPVKKRKRSGLERELVPCDVCTRDIARGQLVTSADGSPVDFYVELVCAVCTERYQRCTDCGGGGGPRLGVGRWRSKELFVDGRLTCRLSHVRHGNPSDTVYDIWRVSDLPYEDSFNEMLTMIREMFLSTTVATLAIPDLLECPEPLARTFKEVEKLAIDGYSLLEGNITRDVEETEGLRRYVAIRWSSVAPRKKTGGKEAPPDLDAAARQKPTQLIREDKTLAGIVLGEVDLHTGSVFVPLSMPKGTGDSYDAATALQQVMLRRMQFDLDATNSSRSAQGQPLYPNISEVWSIQLYKKESRILNRLESQRGFLPLAEYLAKYPSVATPTHFPPHRKIYLPNEFLAGWRIYVRRFGRDQDLTVKTTKTRRKGPSKGQKKGEAEDSEDE